MISVVDDDEAVRSAIGGFVRSLGLRAYTFGSAEEFLNSDQISKTSCLISDVQMPKMSGLDLQKHLMDNGKNIPIIFMTAFANESIKDAALRSGAVSFLSKPFELNALADCIETALARSEPTSNS